MKPMLAIMIPNYNYGRYLAECLDSLFSQTRKDFAVYFRDNCSTDDSYEIAQSFRQRFEAAGIPFRIARNEVNLGSDRNTELIIRDTTEPYRLTLASDDHLAPQFVEKCMAVLENNSRISMIMTHRFEVDETGDVRQTVPFYNTDCIVPGEAQAAVFMMAGIAIPSQRIVNHECFQKVERFRKNHMVAGDWYNNFLGACCGDIAYIKEPLCYYRVHAGNETNESEIRMLGVTEHYLLIHSFMRIADSLGFTRPQIRYEEAIRHLGDMCKRYAVKMLRCGYPEVAIKYLYQGCVYKPDLPEDGQYLEIKKIAEVPSEEKREELLRGFLAKNEMNRVVSYDPPEGWKPLEIKPANSCRSSS